MPSLDSPFRNEPLTDFSDAQNIATMQAALQSVRAQSGETYPLILGGERVFTKEVLASRNPARREEIVGYAACADKTQAARAVDLAVAAFASWRQTAPAQRAEYLRAIAAEMRKRKFELAAWMIYEVSKNWIEADADVAEAIDFCEFYAHQSLRLAEPQPVLQWPGERNEAFYIPLGAGVTIPPWNFPLAILCGTTVAPIACGNTTVLKPSPRAPIIAAKFMEALDAAGLPPGVVNFVTGHDAEIGDALTAHPQVRFIAFTGSKDVGLHIAEMAATRRAGQNALKRAILEMGGKDTIIVDETADLDAAGEGIVASAFGYQGQKCSACSRVVAVESIHDALLDKVAARAAALRVGDPAEPGTQMGALIDERALAKVRTYLAIGEHEGERVLGGETDDAVGSFAWPTIFRNVAAGARLAQEEVFGPVLAFLAARDFEEALGIANATEYGLTGGVYSRDAGRLQRARAEFEVGNLYLNRKITGALVGVQPFGGFKMSGTDSKAGGRDYLLQFLQLKSVAEKIQNVAR